MTALADIDIANYTTGLKWLYEHMDFEKLRVVKYDEAAFNLDRMHTLLDALGNPHKQLRTVQVVGTKGKGSTCSMLAAMMQECGYAVGLYASPHLVDLRERITINGGLIPYNEVTELFREIQAVESSKRLFKQQPLTFFEIMTAAAFRYFAEQAVDVAVMETGLGGRLDCVTAGEHKLLGMTEISLDHTHILGESLEKIAAEKAGAFKPDLDVISVPQPKEVTEVFKQKAEEIGCRLEFVGEEIDFSWRFEANKDLGPHARVCLVTERSRFEHLAVPLKGEHQAANCGLSLAMLDRLKLHGMSFDETSVVDGLANTHLAGRMEQVWSQPRVIIDGAHNPASLAALIKALGAHLQYDSLVMIFGCGQDKDIPSMLKQVALGADKVVFTTARNSPRAASPIELLKQFAEVSPKMAQTAPRLDEALKIAGRAVSREDLVIITGSFYLAGEARKYFSDLRSKKKADRQG